MRSPTPRESLTARYSVSASGWALTIVPASIIVFAQEVTTPYPTLWPVVLSAALQQLAGGVWAVAAVAVQRVAPRVDRLALRMVLWTVIGVSRGLIGGIIAAALAGAAPGYGYRVLFWVIATWIWMPALSYAEAQIAARRELLAVRDLEREWLHAETASSAEHREALRESLLAAVQASVGPAVAEIRARLTAMGALLDAASTREIGERIAGIARDADRIVRGVAPAGSPDLPGRMPRAPLRAAIDFDQRRPLCSAAATGVILSSLLIPESLRLAGPPGAVCVLLGIVTSVMVTLIATGVERVLNLRSARARVIALAVRVLAAGSAGSFAILAVNFLLGKPVSSTHAFVTAVMLPIFAGVASLVVPMIASLREANVDVGDEIVAIREARLRLRAEGGSEDDRTRAQVAEILHGTIQGRLSACAMALSFHAAAGPPPTEERTAFITQSVLDHLSSVADALDELAHRPSAS